LAKLVNGDELMFLLFVVFFYLCKQESAVTFAFAGNELHILRVYANAFDFHCVIVFNANLQIIMCIKKPFSAKTAKIDNAGSACVRK